jgi:hypothetical protein
MRHSMIVLAILNTSVHAIPHTIISEFGAQGACMYTKVGQIHIILLFIPMQRLYTYLQSMHVWDNL